jgi:two-component sensor histidine kinase
MDLRGAARLLNGAWPLRARSETTRLTEAPTDTSGLNAGPGEGLLRAAFDASPRPLLLIAADAPKYTMLAVNHAHARAFATTPDALVGWGVLEVFGPYPGPEAAQFVDAIRTSFERVLATRAPDQMAIRAYAVQMEDGPPAERYWSATNVPIQGSGGRVTHILSAVQDVTGEVLERRSETARSLLMREVDHRARNALTVVQSFVRLTTANSLEEYREVLSGRVEALARAQTSLAARRWEGASLRDVIDAELAALAEPGRYALAGPHLMLPAHHVQSVSMMIHELATNAAKYGSLSAPDGRLAVTWSAGAEGRVRLLWSEESSILVTAPVRVGFGSRLIGDLARQFGGAARFDWRPRGLTAALELALD